MKLYTTSEQTAKLIELGFEKPKHTFTFKLIELNDVKMDIDIPVSNYSIGELIEMLPSRYNGEDFEINRDWRFERWVVFYRGDDATAATELVDALYDMIVKLKAEGVI